jgi:hypothetical protein
MNEYPLHDEENVVVDVSGDELFLHMDDPARLGAHMGKRSMMMMGGRMAYSLDDAQGRAVGSVIRMTGSFAGIELRVEEVVVERAPPQRKVWETRGPQRLIVLDGYRMGFEIVPDDRQSRLRVFLDYRCSQQRRGYRVRRALARVYARWCVSRMAKDPARHFSQRS